MTLTGLTDMAATQANVVPLWPRERAVTDTLLNRVASDVSTLQGDVRVLREQMAQAASERLKTHELVQEVIVRQRSAEDEALKRATTMRWVSMIGGGVLVFLGWVVPGWLKARLGW